MEWFINVCAIILLTCVTTVMVSLTMAGVALLWSKVRREVFFYENRSYLNPQDLGKFAADQFDAELKKRSEIDLRRGGHK
jgi:hypothetical protein